jgi:hypothetical protein
MCRVCSTPAAVSLRAMIHALFPLTRAVLHMFYMLHAVGCLFAAYGVHVCVLLRE